MQRIVIVGGGAGGLVLATQLGLRYGKNKKALVTLVDSSRTHIWKPLLHQLAAGTFDTHAEEIEYLAQARWNSFNFRLGNLIAVDRTIKTIHLAATVDAATGKERVSAQTIAYDTLVLAVGSKTNDFGTPGANQHSIKLDNPTAANDFHEKMMDECIKEQITWTNKGANDNSKFIVTIVGGGATGVELAAELHTAAKVLGSYGLEHINPEVDMRIVLVEAGPRLLATLPKQVGAAALKELKEMKVEVHINAQVTKVDEQQLHLSTGEIIPSRICVWAAGIKAPAFLRTLGEVEEEKKAQRREQGQRQVQNKSSALPTNKLNQILVNGWLQSTVDSSIFAFGDCAACVQPDGENVPARAQAAYQQAVYLANIIPKLTLQGQGQGQIPPFLFVDKGSLVSLSTKSALGSILGSGGLFIEGKIAKIMYWALHKQHQFALLGLRRTLLITLSEFLDRAHRPTVKLH